MKNQVLVIGIGGLTCAGKTTASKKIKELLPNIPVTIFSQDNYIFPVTDERHTWIRELNHINFDIISSMDMAQMHADVNMYLKDKELMAIEQTENSQNNSLVNVEILLIEGFLIFDYPPFVDLFQLRYFFKLDKKTCQERRLRRVYEHSTEVDGYFDQYVWPQYLTHLEFVEQNMKNIKYIIGISPNPENEIIQHIFEVLNIKSFGDQTSAVY